jgi:hypothetical protein
LNSSGNNQGQQHFLNFAPPSEAKTQLNVFDKSGNFPAISVIAGETVVVAAKGMFLS